jgi:hypothetical protein
MNPPNVLAIKLFAGMLRRPLKEVPRQALVPQQLINEFYLLPKHHPLFLSDGDPELEQRTAAERFAAQSLELDYQGRRNTLHAIFQMMLAFKFDYLQLKEGAAPYDPPNPTLEKLLIIHCEYASQADKQIMDMILNYYQNFFEKTWDITEIILASAVAAIQAVVGNEVQPAVE